MQQGLGFEAGDVVVEPGQGRDAVEQGTGDVGEWVEKGVVEAFRG